MCLENSSLCLAFNCEVGFGLLLYGFVKSHQHALYEVGQFLGVLDFLEMVEEETL